MWCLRQQVCKVRWAVSPPQNSHWREEAGVSCVWLALHTVWPHDKACSSTHDNQEDPRLAGGGGQAEQNPLGREAREHPRTLAGLWLRHPVASITFRLLRKPLQEWNLCSSPQINMVSGFFNLGDCFWWKYVNFTFLMGTLFGIFSTFRTLSLSLYMCISALSITLCLSLL